MDIYSNEQSLQERSTSYNIDPQVGEMQRKKREVKFNTKEEGKAKRSGSRGRSLEKEDRDNHARGRGSKSKSANKEVELRSKGTDVTQVVVKKRSTTERWLCLDQRSNKDCKFVSKSGSHTKYHCEHCNCHLDKVGKGQYVKYYLIL